MILVELRCCTAIVYCFLDDLILLFVRNSLFSFSNCDGMNKHIDNADVLPFLSGIV